jgi:SAM-dependent methyltransferase
MENRFIQKDDEKIGALGMYKIPPAWWSRGYEYAWAKKFLKPTYTIMDAGCGIEHPFKWYASENCKKVYAVDPDGRLQELPGDQSIAFFCCSVEDFPGNSHQGKDLKTLYKFDAIFCISVLEHLQNPANAIKAMANLLRKGKKAIFTIDYPLLHPSVFLQVVEKDFIIGEYKYEEGPNDLVGPGGLRVYTAVLTRK